MASIIYILVIFLLATLWLFIIATNAPALTGESKTRLGFPSSLVDLKDLAELLKSYRHEHAYYVYALFVSAYVYKQAFAIPGSALLNMLSGAIFGLSGGFPLVCILTAIGASCCYLLSDHFGKSKVLNYFPQRINSVQTLVEANREHLFYYLLFARLVPMTPNWFINIASPILNIPLHIFFPSVLIGLMPYNFVCVQTGSVLADISSLDDVFTYNMLFKLSLIAVVALLPPFFMKRHRRQISVSYKFDKVH